MKLKKCCNYGMYSGIIVEQKSVWKQENYFVIGAD